MADTPHIETLVRPPTAERAAEQDAATLGQHNGASGQTEASGGLPQFQFQHWPGQIAYLVLLFVILYVLIAKVFTPRVRKVLDERDAAIGGAIASAKQVQAEAAAQAEAAKKALAEARANAQKTAAEAKAKADAEIKARQDEQETQLAARLGEAEARIRGLRDQAMSHVGEVASDTARVIVEKLTGSAASADQVSAALAKLQG